MFQSMFAKTLTT